MSKNAPFDFAYVLVAASAATVIFFYGFRGAGETAAVDPTAKHCECVALDGSIK